MITYYIWSGTELLGTVKELNKSTALQKAKLIAKFSGKATYSLSTSYIHDSLVFSVGYGIAQPKVSPFKQMFDILTKPTPARN